jgi:hypothetical protein
MQDLAIFPVGMAIPSSCRGSVLPDLGSLKPVWGVLDRKDVNLSTIVQ